MTPKVGGQGGATPSIRDNLSINREEAFYDDIDNSKQQLMENKNQLLAGLSSLPKPTNDFEIVVPEVCVFLFSVIFTFLKICLLKFQKIYDMSFSIYLCGFPHLIALMKFTFCIID